MYFEIANMTINIDPKNAEDWVGLFSALLTPVVAVLGCLIAFFQWKTSEKERKQNLFDKRYDNLYLPILNSIQKISEIKKTKQTKQTKIKKIEKITEDFGIQYFKYRFLISQQDDKKLNKEYEKIINIVKDPEINKNKDIEEVVLFLMIFGHFNEIEKILSKYLRIEPNSFFYNMRCYLEILTPKMWKKYSLKDINDILKQSNKSKSNENISNMKK